VSYFDALFLKEYFKNPLKLTPVVRLDQSGYPKQSHPALELALDISG
jgi:hypothetical protein